MTPKQASELALMEINSEDSRGSHAPMFLRSFPVGYPSVGHPCYYNPSGQPLDV
jgi:hypothetical protein